MPETLTVLTESSLIFLYKCFSICCMPLGQSPFSQTLNCFCLFFLIFTSCDGFIGETLWGGPHTVILEMSTSHLFLLSDHTLHLGVCKLQPLHQIWPVFLHKVLLKPNHAHSFICLCLTCTPLCSVLSDSLQLDGLQPTRLLCPWDFQARNWSGLPFSRPGYLP